MGIFLITFGFMLLVIAAMAIGAIMGRQPIKGSCGGVGAALQDPEYICDLCGNDPNKCEEETAKINAVSGQSTKPPFFEVK